VKIAGSARVSAATKQFSKRIWRCRSTRLLRRHRDLCTPRVKYAARTLLAFYGLRVRPSRQPSRDIYTPRTVRGIRPKRSTKIFSPMGLLRSRSRSGPFSWRSQPASQLARCGGNRARSRSLLGALATCFATCSLWWEPRQRSPPQRRPRWSRVPDVWRSNEVRAAAIGTDDVRRQFDRRLRSPCTTQTSTVPMALGVHFVHTSGHRAPVLGALATCFATCSLWWEPRQRSPPQRRPWPSTMWRKEPDR
jgi:hypothetical protein